MMKWCIIDDCISKGGFIDVVAFESKEEALGAAKRYWESLSKHNKKQRDQYMVGLCNVEEYAPGFWQYIEDENGNIDSDIYEIAKEFTV